MPHPTAMVTTRNKGPSPPSVKRNAFECGHGRPLQRGREARDARFFRPFSVATTDMEGLQWLVRPPWPPSPPHLRFSLRVPHARTIN